MYATVHDKLRAMKRVIAAKKKRDFNPHTFLATIGEGRKLVEVKEKAQYLHARRSGRRCFLYPKGEECVSRLSPRLAKRLRLAS